MAKVKKAKLEDGSYIHFLNDSDGMSSKDYLLVLSTGIFFLFVAIGLVMSLIKKDISPTYLQLLEITVPIVMTVTGGVMGVQAVETFSNRNRKEELEAKNNDEDVYL